MATREFATLSFGALPEGFEWKKVSDRRLKSFEPLFAGVPVGSKIVVQHVEPHLIWKGPLSTKHAVVSYRVTHPDGSSNDVVDFARGATPHIESLQDLWKVTEQVRAKLNQAEWAMINDSTLDIVLTSESTRAEFAALAFITMRAVAKTWADPAGFGNPDGWSGAKGWNNPRWTGKRTLGACGEPNHPHGR